MFLCIRILFIKKHIGIPFCTPKMNYTENETKKNRITIAALIAKRAISARKPLEDMKQKKVICSIASRYDTCKGG